MILVGDDMTPDEIAAARAAIETLYRGDPMSTKATRQAENRRDEANRSARTWRTWAVQREQGGKDATLHHKAADEAAARAVENQRIADRGR